MGRFLPLDSWITACKRPAGIPPGGPHSFRVCTNVEIAPITCSTAFAVAAGAAIKQYSPAASSSTRPTTNFARPLTPLPVLPYLLIGLSSVPADADRDQANSSDLVLQPSWNTQSHVRVAAWRLDEQPNRSATLQRLSARRSRLAILCLVCGSRMLVNSLRSTA